MGDVASDHGLAHAVGADQADVGGLGEEVQAHQVVNGGKVVLGRSRPVVICQGFEAPQVGIAQAPLQAAAGAGVLFPGDQRCDPIGRA